MWSPKTKSNGDRNTFYDNMTQVRPGDVVFSFCDTLIKAVGVVAATAVTAPQPAEFCSVQNPWDQVGWYVQVAFTELEQRLRPKDRIDRIRPTLPTKYSPLQSSGDGIQNVYLASVPSQMADVLLDLLGGQVEEIVAGPDSRSDDEAEGDAAEAAVAGRKDIGEVEKLQLIKARTGQGLFRTRVRLIEKQCRITGISAPRHLRASHIKPWRLSSDVEKLDGNNGLLLAPHVDHLFDAGFISFASDGAIMLSPHLAGDVLKAWGIDPAADVGEFTAEQEEYLEFHRAEVFLV